MQSTDVPAKFQIPFANSSAPADIRAVPVTTADPGAASLTAGFPPQVFTAIPAGGSPPDGRDVQGLFNKSTSWDRWFSAGGPVVYDATFQAAVGGYPKGAVVQSATTFGLFFYCTVENNVTNPDDPMTSVGWTGFDLYPVAATGAYLQFLSTGQIGLTPVNGGKLWINGLNYLIPAGVTHGTTGFINGVASFVYAYIDNTGTMQIEPSATGFTFAVNGMPQKAGDATRTFVGGFGLTGGLFTKQGQGGGSYFNRKTLALQGPTLTNVQTVATIPTELDPAGRQQFFSFGDEAVQISTAGIASNNQAGNSVGIISGLNNAAVGQPGQMYSSSNGATAQASAQYSGLALVGFNTASPFGDVIANVGTFNSTSVLVTLRG